MTVIATPDALAALSGPQAGPAWSALVDRHGLEVWRLIASRVRDVHEAEDAYQEFWAALPKAAERFRSAGPDPERSARAWLMRVAYITAVDRLRRRGSNRLVPMQALDRHEDGMDDHDDHIRRLGTIPAIALDPAERDDGPEEDHAHLAGKVQEAMSNLPEAYRRPLLLHVVGGLSYDELAADLSCTVNHARVKVHRGLKRLREILGVAGAPLSDQALGCLVVAMIPALPPAPPPLCAAVRTTSTKLAAKKTASLAHGSAWMPATIAGACLAVAAVVAVMAAAVHRAPVERAPKILAAAPRSDETTAPARPALRTCPLDGLPASSAYGLRRLRSAYQGPAVRVRAGDGSTERDIGFAAGDRLDATALRALCRDGDGFVAVWYDQGGNGRDLVQRTTTHQPLLVQRGRMLDIGGQAAVRFARGQQWLDAAAPVTVGSITALLRSEQRGVYSEWSVVLASSRVYDRTYFRGRVAHASFDAGGATPSAFFIDGIPTADSAPIDQGKVVTAEPLQPLVDEMLRMGNDQATTQVRGWNGLIAGLLVFPAALTPDQRQHLARSLREGLSGGETGP